jgi:hypothetical protein
MKLFAAVAVAAVLGAVSTVASAAPITTSCPGSTTASSTVRVFTVTLDGATAACLQFGEGNLTGNTANGDAFLDANPTYFLVDKSDNTAAPSTVP